MTYALIDTFAAGDRGRQHDMGPSRDYGRVLSTHHTEEAAEKANARLQRAIKRGHGRNAYLPTIIRELPGSRKGQMVPAGALGYCTIHQEYACPCGGSDEARGE